MGGRFAPSRLLSFLVHFPKDIFHRKSASRETHRLAVKRKEAAGMRSISAAVAIAYLVVTFSRASAVSCVSK